MLIEYGLSEKVNFQRTKTFFLIGTFYFAPLMHYWLAVILPKLVPTVNAIGVVKKLLYHHTFFTPPLFFFFYFAANFFEGKSL